ncbi:MAG: FIST C-terminal domain-containing protein [SAR324 cluster bacterium]|nr:FIST C-terminal domain-containing protein [SAR324 cluster bacterium]
MKWASALSDDESLYYAIRYCSEEILNQFRGEPPDLVVIFVSEHFRKSFYRVPEILASELHPHHVLGCSAAGVIGSGKELEKHQGVSITAAILPNVDLNPFHLKNQDLPFFETGGSSRFLKIPSGQENDFVMLSDPLSFDSERFLTRLDMLFPKSQKVGGLASGGKIQGENTLFLNQKIYDSGMIGLALSGNIQMDTIVARGSRALGMPMFVTECQEDALLKLDEQPALQMLQELYDSLPTEDQQRFSQDIFLGIAKKGQVSYDDDDFLLRQIAGIDQKHQAIMIHGKVEPFSVVQFHLKDGESSKADLDSMLLQYQNRLLTNYPQGALLFSCMERGAYLFGRTGHETERFVHHIGEIPLGGFFSSGEIGSVEGRSSLHGLSSSFGLFRTRKSK